MLRVHCPNHGSDVLIGVRGIDRIVNDEEGILVHWHCPCGGRGTVRTGRRPARRPADIAV